MITYVLFLVGFLVLVKGADFLVAGASSLAARLGVSALVIGLTIVAFGTSTPELVVNLLASWQGNTDIAIGNVLGSNIANILLILGVSAVVCPLAVQRSTVWKEIPFALLAAVVLAFMVSDVALDGAMTNTLSRVDGLVLLSFFIIFLYYIFGIAKHTPASEMPEEAPVIYSLGKSSGMIALGLAGLIVGGKWIVDGAVLIATNLGLSEALIGLTVIAVGTSLPELATSIVAALKRNADIAVGNVVGSNIFNILWILGVSAIINPLGFAKILVTDAMMTMLATVLLFVALFVGSRHQIDRWQGALFVLVYVVYVTFLVIRG